MMQVQLRLMISLSSLVIYLTAASKHKLGSNNAHAESSPKGEVSSVLKCDACRAISYEIWKTLNHFNAKKKSVSYKWSEADLIGIMEMICESYQGIWMNYGIKEADGVWRLSGLGKGYWSPPEIKQTKINSPEEIQDAMLLPEFQQNKFTFGGQWSQIVQSMCGEYMEDIGELDIYEAYKRGPHDSRKLEDFMCYGTSDVWRHCSEPQDQNSKDKKQDSHLEL